MTKKERGDGVKNPIEQPFCFPFSRQDFCIKIKLQKVLGTINRNSIRYATFMILRIFD